MRQAIFQQRPDVILHTAAISDTGYCADHPEQAYRANVELPVWLARAAAETDAKLVAFSSDQVYAGVEQSGPLPETIPLAACQCVWAGQAGNGAAGAGALPERRVAARHMDVRPAGYQLPIRGNLLLNLLRAAQRENLSAFLSRISGASPMSVRRWHCWSLP